MSVSLHHGKWRYEFQKNGKRHRKGGYETELKARIAEAEAMETEEMMTSSFVKLVASRLRELKKRRTPKYHRENKALFKKLIVRWGNKEIKREDIENYLYPIESPHVANKELRFIKALFKHGIERHMWKSDPTRGIRPLPVSKKRKRIPTDEEVRLLLEVATPEERAYLLVVFNTLGRSSSVNNLRWSDVFDDYLILRTRKEKNSDEKEIPVPINGTLREVLDSLPRNGEYVFTNPKTGTAFQYRKNMIRSLEEWAGIPHYGLHAYRHYGASRLANMGVSVTTVQEILGHSSVNTTNIYLQAIKGSTKEAMKLLESPLKSPQKL